ncbi:hypothetical protein L228DRAFT_270374 [Xylona heveae TC161]|uniref:Uncharacterized protein n=1 Tax=Xylona heveae (strain CBS 132557 / TC161) TaxID=1328760 RepID=A0A165AD97_XYLHT|nr:hypothetical protein L228DRAFT_270374 [Xylona heveae TC161]KZF20287.1 hypothetical protein L228DRAFT_270374 [Xylona heveae TC161]
MPAKQAENKPLESRAKPVAICPEYITTSPTMIIIKQHNMWKDFTCFHANSSVLFHVNRKHFSNSKHYNFIDPNNGTLLFKLWRQFFNIKEHFYLKFPSSSASDEEDVSSSLSATVVWKGWNNFNVTLNNMVVPGTAKGKQTTLEMQALTYRHLAFAVYLDGAKIVDLCKIPSREAPDRIPWPDGKKPCRTGYAAWEVDVLAGVDLLLVSF